MIKRVMTIGGLQLTLPFSENNQAGFTLFEIMVTLILAGIMMTGAVFIYINFVDTWEEDNARLELQRQGAYALAEIKNNIRLGNDYLIGTYGSGNNNKITIKNIPTQTATIVAKDIEYYWDNSDTAHYKPIKEKKDAQEVIIIPETYEENGVGKSYFEVDNLTFTNQNVQDAYSNTVAREVRVDLKLKKLKMRETDVEEIFAFTGSARLRNENVQ